MNAAVPQQLMKLSLRRWSTFTPPYLTRRNTVYFCSGAYIGARSKEGCELGSPAERDRDGCQTGGHCDGREQTRHCRLLPRRRGAYGWATQGNTRPLLGRRFFCMCRAGWHIRNLILQRRIYVNGWLCEVRQSRSL